MSWYSSQAGVRFPYIPNFRPFRAPWKGKNSPSEPSKYIDDPYWRYLWRTKFRKNEFGYERDEFDTSAFPSLQGRFYGGKGLAESRIFSYKYPYGKSSSQRIPSSRRQLAPSLRRTRNIRCYFCGRLGHIMRNCYRARRAGQV